MSLFTILAIILLVWVVAGLPQTGWHQYGYGPSGIGAVLLVLILLWLFFGPGLRAR